jgi:putative ABC transport system ATP-binding protein
MSVRQNIGYGLKARRVPKPEIARRVDEVAALLGLSDLLDRRPAQLSGGQRQRVAIARALANGPSIVFADEPTANLDSHTAEEILDLMRRVNAERGVAFLFATHDALVVSRARRVVTLHDGAVASDGKA